MKEITKEKTKEYTELCLKCIGDKIRQLRTDNKLTQFDLACLLDCDKSIISALERGTYKNTSIRTLIKFSYLFEVNINYFLQQ